MCPLSVWEQAYPEQVLSAAQEFVRTCEVEWPLVFDTCLVNTTVAWKPDKRASLKRVIPLFPGCFNLLLHPVRVLSKFLFVPELRRNWSQNSSCIVAATKETGILLQALCLMLLALMICGPAKQDCNLHAEGLLRTARQLWLLLWFLPAHSSTVAPCIFPWRMVGVFRTCEKGNCFLAQTLRVMLFVSVFTAFPARLVRPKRCCIRQTGLWLCRGIKYQETGLTTAVVMLTKSLKTKPAASGPSSAAWKFCWACWPRCVTKAQICFEPLGQPTRVSHKLLVWCYLLWLQSTQHNLYRHVFATEMD